MRNPILTAAAITFAFSLPLSAQTSPDATLKDQLEARKSEFGKMAPDSVKEAYEKGVLSVVEAAVVKKAKQVREVAPDFTLKDAQGQPVSLKSLTAKGPVVLVWYRGGWCPYCNLTVRALQKALPQIQAAGAQLVALTPELPDKAAATAQKAELTFPVLTDLNHEVAKAYGTTFELTPEVARIYGEKFNLLSFNGKAAGDTTLPLAATYIIDQTGVIRWAFLDADYRKRAEPADIVTFLKGMK